MISWAALRIPRACTTGRPAWNTRYCMRAWFGLARCTLPNWTCEVAHLRLLRPPALTALSWELCTLLRFVVCVVSNTRLRSPTPSPRVFAGVRDVLETFDCHCRFSSTLVAWEPPPRQSCRAYVLCWITSKYAPNGYLLTASLPDCSFILGWLSLAGSVYDRCTLPSTA